MRVCIFSPDMDVASFDPERSLSAIPCALSDEAIEITRVTSFPWTEQGQDPHDVYLMASSRTLKMRLCRKWLQFMDRYKWIPTFLGLLPVRICQNEIFETLLGCDPDIVVSLDMKWGEQLSKIIQQKFPQWVCLVDGERPSDIIINSTWRQYNKGVKISIILPTYNGFQYIRRSLESCLHQTFKNIEVIIVDDGSRDGISEIVEGYQDARIKYYRHDTNLGLPEALNTGFRHSTGEYLTWTSDDNYYAENAIEEMVRFLQTYPHVDVVYAESYIIDEKDKGPVAKILRTHPPEWLKIDDGIGACFLYKRKVYETIGEYNPEFFKVEDYEYWVRVWKHEFRMQRLLKPLYYYRFHKDTLTAKYRPEIEAKVKLVKQVHGIS